MVIGIDASRAFRSERTGVEEYAYRLLEGLAATSPAAVKVRLYIQGGDQLSVATAKAGSRCGGISCQFPKEWEIRVLGGPRRLWTHTALAWELWRDPPDVFFQPSHVLPFTATSYKLQATSHVITIHDVGFARIPWAYSGFERWYQHTMTRSAVSCQQSVVRVIVPSEFTKSELMEFYRIAPDRITVIPHATVFQSSPSTGSGHNGVLPERSRRPVTDACGKPFVLSIGRIEKKKNTLGMIQAFEQFLATSSSPLGASGEWQVAKDSHYLLVGPDGYGADEVYEYLALRPELQSRVHLLGYVSEERKQELLIGAQALVHLSHYEGFGLPIAEAQACKIPVITNYQLPITNYQSFRTWHHVARETLECLLRS